MRGELNPKGGRRRRVEKLAAGAERNLEHGEIIHEVVQTQTGQVGRRDRWRDRQPGRSRLRSASNVRGSFALIATDHHVYAMPLGGATLTDVKAPELKIPLSEAQVRGEHGKIVVHGTTFHVMALFGKRAKSFVDYVSEHASAPG